MLFRSVGLNGKTGKLLQQSDSKSSAAPATVIGHTVDNLPLCIAWEGVDGEYKTQTVSPDTGLSCTCTSIAVGSTGNGHALAEYCNQHSSGRTPHPNYSPPIGPYLSELK